MAKQAMSNEQIIAAIITAGTYKAAAEQLHITERTIYDRAKDREFQAMYAAAKADILRQATAAINGKVLQAVDTISEIMADKDINAQTRLQAAQTLLNTVDKFGDRLQAVEAATAEQIKQSQYKNGFDAIMSSMWD